MREREGARISRPRLREFTFVCCVRRNMRALLRGKVSLKRFCKGKESVEEVARPRDYFASEISANRGRIHADNHLTSIR